MTRNTRKRSKSASPDREVMKTPKLNDDVTVGIMKLIDSKFQELNDAINAKMEDLSTNIMSSKSEILSQINTQILELRREYNLITERIIKLESDGDKGENLKAEICFLKEKIEKQENINVSSEIRINGVPSTENEDLFTVFKNICGVINIPTPHIHGIFRVKNISNNKFNDGPIIVKLYSSFERNYLMRSFAMFRRQNRPLTLQQIGFQSHAPIYLNENLTKTNNSIMRAASKYKREKKCSAAYSLRGWVFVRIQQNDAPILIKSLSMLDELMPMSREFRNDGE